LKDFILETRYKRKSKTSNEEELYLLKPTFDVDEDNSRPLELRKEECGMNAQGKQLQENETGPEKVKLNKLCSEPLLNV